MIRLMVLAGTAIPLNEEKRPNSILVRSSPADVARVEERTFICSRNQGRCGPHQQLGRSREDEGETGAALLPARMAGRTMYVIPYSMGPIGSPIANIGVEISDSPYVVANMHIMARIGTRVLDVLGEDGDFVRGLHSLGAPLAQSTSRMRPGPTTPRTNISVISPRLAKSGPTAPVTAATPSRQKMSRPAHRLRSGPRRRLAGRAHAHPEDDQPQPAKSKFITGAFPSACGKTNLAMLIPTIPGWKVETVGDDIAWMKFGADGRLYAINPEYGFFGVAPGTSMKSNQNAMLTVDQKFDFHQLRHHSRPRHLVGGDDRRRSPPNCSTGCVVPGPRTLSQSRPSQRPLHRSCAAVPGDRARVGGSEGRSD